MQGKTQHMQIFVISYQIKNTKSMNKLVWIGDWMMRKRLNVEDWRMKDSKSWHRPACIEDIFEYKRKEKNAWSISNVISIDF